MSALTYNEILISGSDVVIDRLANDMQNLYKEYNEGIVDNGSFIDYSKALNFIETHIVEVNRRIQGNLFAVDENVFDTSVFGEFADSHDRYDYANAINWEDLEREYRYYKTKNDDRFYYQFYRNDYLAKKSLSENQINDIDEYFRFYEEEYGRKFIYNDLKKDVDVEKLKKKYGKWYDDLRTPSSILELQWWFLLLDSLEFRQNEIEINSESKGMGDYFFEWLTENLDVIVKSREQFEDDYRPSTFYYYKGNKIGSKEYKNLVESVKVPGKKKDATKKTSYVQVQFNTNPGIRYTYYMITGKKIEPGQLVDTGNDYFGNYGVVVGVSDKKPDLAGIELTKCKDNMDPSEVFKLNPMLKDKLLALWSRTLIEAKDFSWAKKVNDKIEKKTGDYLINELLIKYSISDLEDLKMVEKSWTKDELTRKIVRTNSIHASNIKNIKKIVASSDYTKYDKMLEEIIDTSQFDNERLNLLKVALIENHTKEQIEYIADPRNSFSRIEQLLDLMSKSLDYRLIRPYYTNSHTDDITKVMTSYSHKEATIFSRDDRYSNFSISSNAVGYVLKIIENQNTRPLLPYFSSPKFEKSDEHEIRIICQLLLNGYTPGEVDYIADISRRGLDHYNKVEYEYNKLSSNPPKNKSDYDGISLEYNFVAALIEELDSYSEPLYFDINGIEFTYLDPILVETKKGVRKAIPVGFYETIKNKKSIKKVLSLAPANYTLYPQEKSTAY